MLIKLTQSEYRKCVLYATKVIDTLNYLKHREQFNKSKIIKDHLIGKIAEAGVCKWLKKNKIRIISGADYKIYQRGKKSFNHDLTIHYNGAVQKVMVKSRDILSKYPPSWIFQYSRKKKSGHYDKETFGDDRNDSSLIFFCDVDIENLIVYIRFICKLKDLHDKKLFKYPVLKHLRKSKRCVYARDMIKKGLF